MILRRLAMVLMGLFGTVPAAAQEVGEGELWVLPHVMQAFEEFQRRPNGLYFAVSTNGWAYNFVSCPKASASCDSQVARREAINACARQHGQETGRCFLFGSSSQVMWQGKVHVVKGKEWPTWLERNADLQRDMARFTRLLNGNGRKAPPGPPQPAEALPDFRAPPPGYSLRTMSCFYLDLETYDAAIDPDFMLVDATGHYCVAAVGYHVALEQVAFQEALAACHELAGAGVDCFVYRAGRQPLVDSTPVESSQTP
jgi:hypothetical protein